MTEGRVAGPPVQGAELDHVVDEADDGPRPRPTVLQLPQPVPEMDLEGKVTNCDGCQGS